jgi:aspartyl-tRNA(Asn)/glutamyl-tRNA(Gln) amidotransferase subunit C
MLTKEDVRRVATMAKLQFAESETEQLAAAMSRILDWVVTMDKLPLAEVAPTAHTWSTANVFREPDLASMACAPLVLEHAPMASENFFTVPKVIG